MTEEELKIANFKHVSEPRKHRVTHSWGVYDAYKYIRKNKWLDIGQNLTEHLFYTIIRKVNDLLALNIINSKVVTLPHRMGKLELRKSIKRVDIVNGKLVTTLPIDWNKTLKLWAEEGKSDTLIKCENREIFKVVYNKKEATYNNKSFYDFHTNRGIKKVLVNKIKNKQIDAFII